MSDILDSHSPNVMWIVYSLLNPLKPVLCEPGFEPFYTGKGVESRPSTHLKEVQRGAEVKNKHRANTIKLILRNGLTPIIHVERHFDNEQEAYTFERQVIAKYGRADLGLGPLTNQTEGGEGPLGRIFTDSYRKKLSVAGKRAHAEGKMEANVKAFISAGNVASRTPSARAKNSATRTGKKRSVETRARLVTARQKFIATLTEQERKEHFGTMRGKKHKAASLRKMSTSITTACATPETKARRSAANIGSNNPRAKQCELLGVTYGTISEASVAVGWHRKKVKSHPTFKVFI